MKNLLVVLIFMFTSTVAFATSEVKTDVNIQQITKIEKSVIVNIIYMDENPEVIKTSIVDLLVNQNESDDLFFFECKEEIEITLNLGIIKIRWKKCLDKKEKETAPAEN
jgi:hypothetical protein